MGDQPSPEQQKKIETGIARTEITLAALREEPMRALLQEGVESAYTSVAKKTEKGLQVDTENTKTHRKSSMVVDGTATGSRGVFSTELTGDFTITHGTGQGARVEKDKFQLKGSNWDEVMGRPDLFNVGYTRTDASGKPFQVYEPAISEPVIKDGRYQLDPNGQPLRVAKPAGSDNNAGRENIGNPGNRRLEATFIIHDAKLGDLSYNQTKETTVGGYYYRSVVRDMQSRVLGIVEQDFKVDANNEITSVTTSARKPRQIKK